MFTVAFVFDYVMHYHRDTLRAIEAHVLSRGGRFVLFTAHHAAPGSGRAPLAEKVAQEQRTYELFEKKIGGFTIRNQLGLVQMVEALKPNVVVTMCHSGTFSEWQLTLLKRRLDFKLIAWQSGYEYNPGKFKDWILSRFIPHFDHHLCYHTNAKHYAVRYGARPDQVTVMHNTINEQRISCLDKDQARRTIADKFPNLTDKVILLYVGAVLEEKRLSLVIRAMELLKMPQLVFVVVGDGPHLPHLRAATASRPDVVYAGRVVDGVGPFFDASDVFILPGTGGLAINEAMVHGLPVISSYADGSADDLVVNDVNGFRLVDASVEEIAGHIRSLVSDPELRLRMGEESRRLIRTRFSFAQFIERVCGAIDRECPTNTASMAL